MVGGTCGSHQVVRGRRAVRAPTTALRRTELEAPHSMVVMADVANMMGRAERRFRSMYPAAN